MANRFQHRDKFRRPEIFLAELLQKSARGKFRETDENVPVLYRAIVYAVDVLGGQLENPDGNGEVQHELASGTTFRSPANVGPKNPKNSIKARIITDGFDQFLGDSKLRVFWPLFPEQAQVPIKPGEHVYVMFEDTKFLHGLWLGKLPGHEGVNFVPGSPQFQTPDDDTLTSKFDDSASAAGSDQKKYNTDIDVSETGIKDGHLAKLFDDTPKRDGDG